MALERAVGGYPRPAWLQVDGPTSGRQWFADGKVAAPQVVTVAGSRVPSGFRRGPVGVLPPPGGTDQPQRCGDLDTRRWHAAAAVRRCES